jgi:fibrillarin-like pre-rRNA processing protein
VNALRERFPGVFEQNRDIITKNLSPGTKTYGEELIKIENIEYRKWNPWRSKLAAAIKNNLKEFPVKKGSSVLYLGCAEGTTVSHISDIVQDGVVFGVDLSAKAMQKFNYVCESRENVLPILADADNPESYSKYVENLSIDVLYQDVSQRNQAEIFIKNAKKYLKKGGYGMLCIKAHSIDSTARAEDTVKNEAKKLEPFFEIIQILSLNPFDKEHGFVLCRRK